MDYYLSFLQSFFIIFTYYYFFIKFLKKTNIDFFSFNFLFLYHLIFSIFYIIYSLNNVADAKTVWIISQTNDFDYYKEQLLAVDVWEIGRGSSLVLATIIYRIFHFNYFAMTIFYSLISLTGLLLLYSIVCKYVDELKINNFKYLKFFFIFPSLHFWNCSVSKDAIIFFSICLFIFAFFNFRKYLPWLILSLIIMFFFRPYIGIIFLFFVFFDFVFNYKMNKIAKFCIVFFLCVIFIFLLRFSLSYIGIEIEFLYDFDKLYERISITLSEAKLVASNQKAYIDKGSSFNILYYYLVYLFYPLNFFHDNVLYIISSFENLVLLIFFILLVLSKSYKNLIKCDYILIFIFFIILTLLSIRTMNYGISMRQKWMLFPILFIFLINKNKYIKK